MIGVDIVYIPKIKKIIERNDNYIKRFFSDKEYEFFHTRDFKAEVIAANFAAKEALIKAIGIGLLDIDFRNISVLRKDNGKPYMEISDDRYSDLKTEVSISHDNDYAVGFVILKDGRL